MKVETFRAGRWQQRLLHKSFEPVLVHHARALVKGKAFPLTSARSELKIGR